MDKALNIILKARSCESLIDSIIDIVRYSEVETDILMKKRSNYEEVVRHMFQGSTDRYEANGSVDVMVSDTLYIILASIAIILGDPYIGRFSLRFSKNYRQKILEALDEENILLRANTVGLKMEYRETCFKELLYSVSQNNTITSICYRYRIPIHIYLTTARKLLTEPSWKLSAFLLHKGYVYIDDKEKAMRLVSESIHNIVSSRLRELRTACGSLDNFKQNLLNTISSVYAELGSAVEEFLNSITKMEKRDLKGIAATALPVESTSIEVHSIDELASIARALFPPCIQELIEKVMKGENLSHHQRFALATFLINTGIDLDIIIKLFSYSPDFNERIARYQIEHLAGLKGSKKKYLVYNCNTMRTLGICKAECNTRNPLTYLRKLLSSSQRKGEKAETRQ